MDSKKNTDVVAEYCANFKYEDIPEDVLHITKQVFLDTIGIMLGSVDLDKGRFGIDLAEAIGGGSDECTLVGTVKRVSAPAAAYGNGELAHGLDADILMAPCHMTSYMMSAVLAAAEKKHVSGKKLLTALVLAIDIASRVGLSQGGFRVEATEETKKLSRAEQCAILDSYGMGCICFGGTVGVTHIFECNEDQIKDALGHCGFMLPEPSHQRFLFGPRPGNLKYSPAGWQNLVAYCSGLMGSMGIFGDREIFDGRHGFWAMQGTPQRIEEWLTKDLGKYFAVRDVRYKYYPVDGVYQAICNVVEALVREHDIKPDQIERIHAHMEFLCPGYENKIIENSTDAPASFYYCVSCAAHLIPAGPLWHAKETRENPSILALMDRIDSEDDPASDIARQKDREEGYTYINRRPATVDITMKDGSFYTKSQEYMRFMSCGHPDYAITNEQLEEKFRRNSEFTFTKEKQDQAIKGLWNLEDMEDIASELMPLLVP